MHFTLTHSPWNRTVSHNWSISGAFCQIVHGFWNMNKFEIWILCSRYFCVKTWSRGHVKVSELREGFSTGKTEFWSQRKFSGYHRLLTWGKILLIHLLFHVSNILIMKISTYTEIHKYRKSVVIKKSTLFKKMGLKFWNPKN